MRCVPPTMVSKNGFRLSKVLILSLGHFSVDFYAGFLPVLVPVLQQAMGFSLTQAAFLISALTLSASLSQSFFGYVFDRWRNTAMVALAPAAAAVTVSCLGIMPSYPTLVMLVIASGVAVAAFHPHGAALTAIESGDRHSVGMSIFVTGGTAGVAVGALAASTLVQAAGLPATVYAMGFGLAMAYLIRRNIGGERLAAPGSSQPGGPFTGGYSFLLFLGLLAMMRAFIIMGFQSFVPLYITGQGATLPTVGVTLFVFGISGGLGGLTGGSWAERIGEKGVLSASFLIPIPLFLGYLLLGSTVAGIACFGLAGYSIFTGVPVLIAISQRSFPKRVGTMSSLVMGVSWGVAGLCLTPTAAIAERVGLYTTLWGLGLVGFVGFGIVLLVFAKKPAPAAPTTTAEPENWETT